MSFISRVSPDRKTENSEEEGEHLYSTLILFSRIYSAHTFQVDTTGSQHLQLNTHTHFRVLLQLTAMNKTCSARQAAETLTTYSNSAGWLVPPLQKDLFTAVHCCTKLNVWFVGVAGFINIFLIAFWRNRFRKKRLMVTSAHLRLFMTFITKELTHIFFQISSDVANI